MKQLLYAGLIASTLTACGNTVTTPEAKDDSATTPSPQELQALLAKGRQALGQTQHGQEVLQKLGLTSLDQLSPGKMYFQTPEGLKTLDLNVTDETISGQSLSGGIGQGTVKEDIYGISSGRLNAYSKSTLSCNAFFPIPGNAPIAQVLHTVTTLAPPNGNPFKTAQGGKKTGPGYVESYQADMGGSIKINGTYIFSYLIEGVCDGITGYGQTASAWSIQGTNANRINTPVVEPAN